MREREPGEVTGEAKRSGPAPSNIVFFASGEELRSWFEKHAEHASEFWVGFYNQASGKGGLTYKEAVDEALCVGWIDGIRKKIDADSYTNRFTPRKPRSIWSAVNIKRVGELTALGRMRPAGLRVFESRDPRDANQYSFEQGEIALDEDEERRFRDAGDAWTFFQTQAPFYKKAAIWWVLSAKRPETRERRLQQLIETSATGQRLAQFVSPSRRAR